MTQYVITRNAQNKDVYKRRVVMKKRVRKERDDEYFIERDKALSARAKKQDTTAIDKKVQKYQNMFSKFAENYANTIQHLVDESKDYLRKKAQNRRTIHTTEKVNNI